MRLFAALATASIITALPLLGEAQEAMQPASQPSIMVESSYTPPAPVLLLETVQRIEAKVNQLQAQHKALMDTAPTKLDQKCSQDMVATTKPLSAPDPDKPASMDKDRSNVFKKDESGVVIHVEDKAPATNTVKADDAAPKGLNKDSAPSIDDEKKSYQEAFKTLQEKQYDQASKLFIAFIENYPETKLRENAYYWLAETYYAQEQFQQSAIEFLNSYQQYPAGNKAPDSLLKLALSLQKLDKQAEACGTLDKLSLEFPEASEAILERRQKEYQAMDCS